MIIALTVIQLIVHMLLFVVLFIVLTVYSSMRSYRLHQFKLKINRHLELIRHKLCSLQYRMLYHLSSSDIAKHII